MEKARSLLEAEPNLDEIIEDEPRSPAAPSGFAPASASRSGLSPAGPLRPEPSGLYSRPLCAESDGLSGAAAAAVPGDRLVEGLQSALGAASRHEAGLGSLQRAIRDASRAFTASRQEQAALTEELRLLHRGLNELMSEKAAVERYAALLTQERDAALDAAEEARRDAKREREFLQREQDRFIQLLLEEHEAEIQQWRGGANRQRGRFRGDTLRADDAPATVPGLVPAFADQPVEGRKSSPPGELSGAALARQALASSEPLRSVPLPEASGGSGEAGGEARRTDDERLEEHTPTYPPPPAVLDLDSLAAEVDGNSERPPPIRRLDAKLRLEPARVPVQLFDTLVSSVGELDPNRKG